MAPSYRDPCPTCGNPNLTGSSICSFCGHPMKQGNSSSPSSSGTSHGTSSPPPPPRSGTTPTTSGPYGAGSGSGSSSPVPVPSRTPAPGTGSASASWSWPTPAPPTPLPRSMQRLGSPVLEGIVEDVKDIQVGARPSFGQETARATWSSVLLITKPAIWLSSLLVRSTQSVNMNTHWILVVRRSDHTLKQARIEGDLTRAIVSRGDYVSLWGREKGGVLVIKQGFNHTAMAEIQFRRR